jgi:hypothetical protein
MSDELTPRQRDEIWRRSDVLESARHAVAMIDNPARPQALRDYASILFKQCSEILLHQNDPEKRVVLVPLSFRVTDFYRDMWVDFLTRLPEEVVDDNPIHVAMGEQAADLVDDDSYSSQFRLEALEAFKTVMAGMEVAAQRHLSLVPGARQRRGGGL